jgi:hypothetical protein
MHLYEEDYVTLLVFKHSIYYTKLSSSVYSIRILVRVPNSVEMKRIINKEA